jgi:hypothetical protein
VSRQPKPIEGTLNCQQRSWELHLDGWLHLYNHHRAHTALGGQPPHQPRQQHSELLQLAARATQLVEVHGHATFAALHSLNHRLIARLLLEADGHRPGFEHVLQRSKVLGLGGDR